MQHFSPPELAARPAVRSLARACTATALAAISRRRAAPDEIARGMWRDDPGAGLIARGAVVPDDLGTASALGRVLLPEFLATLTPSSAGAEVLRAGLRLRFDGAASISVPTLFADAAYAAFVADGTPIPIAQASVAPLVTLTPKKLLAVVVLTAEMIRSSNVEALMLDALIRSASLALDLALFDDLPATAARDAGLRYGQAALNASNAVDEHVALIDDIETLSEAVEDITAAPGIFVASPVRALMMSLRSYHGIAPNRPIGSAALANTSDVICIVPPAIVSAFGGLPQIEIAREATLHMETAPTDIGMTDTPPPANPPNIVAAPTRSLWQTDAIALKVRFPIAWGLRDPRGVAWLRANKW